MTADYGEPVHRIEGGEVEFTETGLVAVTIRGAFEGAVASGAAEIDAPSPCGRIEVTWEAELGGAASVAAPPILIPTMEIEEGLFDTEAGTSRVDDLLLNAVVGELGDWFLLRSNMRSFIAVPQGWATHEAEDETFIFFNESGDLSEAPEALVDLWAYGPEKKSSPQVLAKVKKTLGKDDSLILEEVVDRSRAFAILRVSTDSGEDLYVIEVFAWKETESLGYRLEAFTAVDRWDEFYPILRLMVASWIDLEGHSLSVPLPESVPKS
jgi:hypothetical protein